MFTLKPTGGTLPIDWAFPPRLRKRIGIFLAFPPPFALCLSILNHNLVSLTDYQGLAFHLQFLPNAYSRDVGNLIVCLQKM